MSDPKLNYAITATDATRKGVASSKKRFSGLAKDVAKVGRDTTGPKQFLRQVAEMERATSKALGSRSITASIGGRLGGVAKVGQAVGGMGEAGIAAEAGGALEALAGAAGVAAGALGAVVGVAAALIAGEDAWMKGAAAVGRLALATGQATEKIDAWAGAGERQGIDRKQTESSIAALGKRLNDARYGRSNETLALNNQLGLGVKNDANGVPDVTEFLAQLADKIGSQKNAYTQQEIAERYGVKDMLPLLRMGQAAVREELAKQSAEGVITPGDAAGNARRYEYEKKREMQILTVVPARVAAAGSGGVADAAKGIADGSRSALDAVNSGVAAAPKVIDDAVHVVQEAIPKFGHALDEGTRIVARRFGQLDAAMAASIEAIARRAKADGANVHRDVVIARIESHFRANARTGINKKTGKRLSSAGGNFQFLDGTARDYGLHGDDRFDPTKATGAYDRKERDLLPTLERRLGRRAKDWEVYMLHQQGLAGATKELTGDQNRNAVSVLGHDAVVNNGGKASSTLGDMNRIWERRYAEQEAAARKEGAFDIADRASGGAPTPPPAKAEVTIRLAGAPPGTITGVTAQPGVDVRVERSMSN